MAYSKERLLTDYDIGTEVVKQKWTAGDAGKILKIDATGKVVLGVDTDTKYTAAEGIRIGDGTDGSIANQIVLAPIPGGAGVTYFGKLSVDKYGRVITSVPGEVPLSNYSINNAWSTDAISANPTAADLGKIQHDNGKLYVVVNRA